MDYLLLDENSCYYLEGRWYDPSEYNLVVNARGYEICSYCPGKGENRGLFCGNEAVSINGNPNNYRCEDCKDKEENYECGEIGFRWLLPEHYFDSRVLLCSFTPKSGPNFGRLCGLPAVNRGATESGLRCNLCRTDKSNLGLFRLYKEIRAESMEPPKKVISHRIKKAKYKPKSSMF